MKQKHVARLAAFSVGVMGGAAFGDHHGGGPVIGPQENCSEYPWWCWGQCAELNICRSGNTPIGGSDCGTEEANLASCRNSPPPFVPPVIIVPPPACPAGQHLNAGECEADCGDDEIVGEDGTCTGCGDGEAPNEDGTACETCEHGESGDSSGVCAGDPCGLAALDVAASNVLGGVNNREPRERGRALYCLDDEIGRTHWTYSSPGNVCAVSYDPKYWDSCWVPGGRDGPCDLASVHTHPYFTKTDKGKKCHGEEINEDRAKAYNNAGMNFSSTDLSLDQQFSF